jgi:hypothetical protein
MEYSNRPGNERERLEGEELEGEVLKRKGLKGLFFVLAQPKKNLDLDFSYIVEIRGAVTLLRNFFPNWDLSRIFIMYH